MLVVASGTNRVDERKVAALLGQKIGRADPDFVLLAHGIRRWAACRRSGTRADLSHFSIGSGAISDDLGRGGLANAVFALLPADLARLTAASFVDIAKPR